MVSIGFDPRYDDEQPLPVRVSRERLSEFDRIVLSDGLSAIIEACARLKKSGRQEE